MVTDSPTSSTLPFGGEYGDDGFGVTAALQEAGAWPLPALVLLWRGGATLDE